MPCLSLMHVFAARANQKRHKLISVKFNTQPSLDELRLKLKNSPRFIAFAQSIAARTQQTPQATSTASTTPVSTPAPAVTTTPAASKSRAANRKADRLAKAMAKRARKEFLRLLPKGRRSTRADLINAESQLGSTIFGPVPAGHRREFFHDRQNIWIWHEDWYDATLRHRQITVRYEVRISGIYKKVAAGEYYKLEGDELSNFRLAARVYLHLIKTHLYPPALLSRN